MISLSHSSSPVEAQLSLRAFFFFFLMKPGNSGACSYRGTKCISQRFWILILTLSLHYWEDSCTVKDDRAAPFFLYDTFSRCLFGYTKAPCVVCWAAIISTFVQTFLEKHLGEFTNVTPLKLNFTPSSKILKQAYGHQVYFCLLLNASICFIINPCEHLRKRCLSYYSSAFCIAINVQV